MKKEQLEQCINEYGKDIYSFCKYLTGNLQEAEDLYQDTFLKAVELMNNIDFEKNPKSYLLSVAVRIWKNRKRKFAWRNRIAGTELFREEQSLKMIGKNKDNAEKTSENLEENVYQNAPEEMLMQKERNRMIRQQINRLPEKLRVVILLYYMEELTIAEIAAVLKIPLGTVKSRLYQARKKLEKELEVVLDETGY